VTDPAEFLVETPWETRNLELPSYAVRPEFFQSPDFRAFKEALDALRERHGKYFVFARIAKELLRWAPGLAGCGFSVVEGVLSLHSVLEKNEVFQRFLKDPGAALPGECQVTPPEFVTLRQDRDFPGDSLRGIALESFSDDRFHQDPRCPEERANRRFRFWVDDLMSDRATEFDALRLDAEVIGFLARQENRILLAGFARRMIGKGLGRFLFLGACRAMWEARHDTVDGGKISMNNMPILNLYAQLGFRFKAPGYTFHYWS
jgi:hypothetical protein